MDMGLLKDELNTTLVSEIKDGIGNEVTPADAFKMCKKAYREGRLTGEIGRIIRVASNNPYEQLTIMWEESIN